MSFYEVLHELKSDLDHMSTRPVTVEQVQRALAKATLTPADLWALLSPAAAGSLETMAQKAHALTIRHFGRNMMLFAPLYLSNYCVNRCVYCGFSSKNEIPREKLSLEQVDREGRAIAATGLKHILILTGESREHSPVSYMKECVQILSRYFPSISVEVYPLTREEYAELAEVGVDGMTIFQEVYNEPLYGELHPKGPKHNFRNRLEAPERAGKAGLRTINIGALLGLDDWRREAFCTAMHAAYLQECFPEIEISVSLPRMRPECGGYEPQFPVDDRALVQILLALRLFLPRVGITISTRERPDFRDHLIPLGTTKMSAGSLTTVGGYARQGKTPGQFEISDPRSVQAIYQVIRKQGYQPVFKDWHWLRGAQA